MAMEVTVDMGEVVRVMEYARCDVAEAMWMVVMGVVTVMVVTEAAEVEGKMIMEGVGVE